MDLGIILVSDAIDSWSAGESRTALLERLRAATERGGELALEVSRLEDEVDGLRFNGPTLYRDEVEAIKAAIDSRTDRGDHGHVSFEMKDALGALLTRCDHMPMTAEEFGKMADDAINGRRTRLYDWDDVTNFFNDIGKDVDE